MKKNLLSGKEIFFNQIIFFMNIVIYNDDMYFVIRKDDFLSIIIIMADAYLTLSIHQSATRPKSQAMRFLVQHLRLPHGFLDLSKI